MLGTGGTVPLSLDVTNSDTGTYLLRGSPLNSLDAHPEDRLGRRGAKSRAAYFLQKGDRIVDAAVHRIDLAIELRDARPHPLRKAALGRRVLFEQKKRATWSAA